MGYESGWFSSRPSELWGFWAQNQVENTDAETREILRWVGNCNWVPWGPPILPPPPDLGPPTQGRLCVYNSHGWLIGSALLQSGMGDCHHGPSPGRQAWAWVLHLLYERWIRARCYDPIFGEAERSHSGAVSFSKSTLLRYNIYTIKYILSTYFGGFW